MGNAVVLTHTRETFDTNIINNDFNGRIGQIEKALESIRNYADQWNQRLPLLVQPTVDKRRTTLQQNQNVTLGYPRAVIPVRHADAPRSKPSPARYDVFLSHASEDKESIARPLFDALTAAGLSVWFDEAVLRMGDSLSAKIDEGLAKCGHGVVIISPSFLAKNWPKRELAGLVAREIGDGGTKILPIWHEMNHATLLAHSPTLADRVAVKSSEGIPALVGKILDVVRSRPFVP